MSRLVLDIETDGLLTGELNVPHKSELSHLWCIGIRDLDTDEVTVYHGDTLEEGVRRAQAADLWSPTMASGSTSQP